MKKLFILLGLAVAIAGSSVATQAQAPVVVAPVKADPNDQQRISDLEAYVNNTARGADSVDSKVVSKISGAGPGHNGFQMVCAALVLFMTLPGLFLFYGGLVRKKNILSVVAQCFGIAGLVTILWFLYGYSFVFGDGAGSIIGNLKFALFEGVDSNPNTNYSYWVSHNVFSIYQLMFAIITPALIIGAIAERMKFSAIMIFIALWMVVVYFPLAHMVWGINGLMNGVWNADASIKAIDFAGGTVVHMSSGWSALVLCLLLGKRLGYGKEPMQPHSMTMCAIGTGMLWVGWYGFNAGSAVAADGIAANAFTTTTIAAAVASFAWAMAEYVLRGKPSILGFCSGAVAGLVVVTPACGFITPGGSFIIGILAGIIPFFACWKLKAIFGYDDALDTFGVHAVGGTMGALLTGMLARNSANANLSMNLKNYVTDSLFQPLVVEQIKAIAITIALSIVATLVIGLITKALVGLRTDEDVETVGLDLAEHGEEGYHG
ncbi:MAG: ammonium transporter [Pedosphaera sp.]|nr:ammonium transporter [Pedosphaera sp.]